MTDQYRYDEYGNRAVTGPPNAFFPEVASAALGVDESRQFRDMQKRLIELKDYWDECNRKPILATVINRSYGFKKTNRRSNK